MNAGVIMNFDVPSMQVWDVSAVASAADESSSSAQPVQLQSTAVVAAHDKDINAVAVSPNDALICTASQDRTAKVPLASLYAPFRLHITCMWSAHPSSSAWHVITWAVFAASIDVCVPLTYCLSYAQRLTTPVSG